MTRSEGMKLTMRLGERSYDIIVKSGSLENLYQFARLANLARKVFIVTDSGVPPEYAAAVKAQCAEGVIYTVPQGESSKSLKTYEALLCAMLEAGFGRGDAVVAVGGGVVGDLAGFAAAIYMRGIDFINCPTTTLAQIDSSIGGKVAVDLGRAKNIVGAFWQPKLVVVDPDTLANEYFRDVNKGLDIAVPENYFAQDDPSRPPVVRWRSAAQLFYTNWLNYYVYQTTPYDLRNISST